MELLKLVEKNFDKFIDIKNTEFPYLYGIYYTDYWKVELSKLGLRK
ncbi:hypothetical protein ACFS5M_12660 [Lacinutrix iliipiscaria]|uniref:Uncharacterized protein n=1 Tax=Lacinutrix iliipiscaria TaxID=1230532 RepID=A0ABW5WSW5_9FLAO